MSRNRQRRVIDEFCQKNGYEPYKIYDVLCRNEELAKRLKKNSRDEWVIDEAALYEAAGLIDRRSEQSWRENRKRDNSPTSAVADVMNALTAENAELRKEVVRLGRENEHLKDLLTETNNSNKNTEV